MNTAILTLRNEIDNLDRELLKLLEERFEFTEEIGEIKKTGNIQVEDKQREETLFSDRINNTTLDEKFVTKLFATILEEARRLQAK